MEVERRNTHQFAYEVDLIARNRDLTELRGSNASLEASHHTQQ